MFSFSVLPSWKCRPVTCIHINMCRYREEKVKHSLYRPGELLGVTEVEAPRISKQLAHGSGKVVSSTHRPPLPPGDNPGIHFC
jgi:hypothetical protein